MFKVPSVLFDVEQTKVSQVEIMSLRPIPVDFTHKTTISHLS